MEDNPASNARGKGQDIHVSSDETRNLSLVPEAAEKELAEKLAPLLKAIPAGQRKNIQQEVFSVALSVAENYSGNITHPRIAAGWEEICPGAADRLLVMAEKQEDHRIWWERRALTAGVTFQWAGVIIAFVVSMSLIGGALYCATINQPWVSAAFLAASAVGMVRAFLDARTLGKKPEPETPSDAATATVRNGKGLPVASKRPDDKHRR